MDFSTGTATPAGGRGEGGPQSARLCHNRAMLCPDCQNELSFLCSWTFRGLWGFQEVRTYECPTHGPVFVNPQASVADAMKMAERCPDSGDRDSLILAPLKPIPTLNADAIGIPEPDSD